MERRGQYPRYTSAVKVGRPWVAQATDEAAKHHRNTTGTRSTPKFSQQLLVADMWRARWSKTPSPGDGKLLGMSKEPQALARFSVSARLEARCEQDIQWVLDELGDGRNVLFGGSSVCEDLCQMTDRVKAQVESVRLKELLRAARHDSHFGDPR